MTRGSFVAINHAAYYHRPKSFFDDIWDIQTYIAQETVLYRPNKIWIDLFPSSTTNTVPSATFFVALETKYFIKFIYFTRNDTTFHLTSNFLVTSFRNSNWIAFLLLNTIYLFLEFSITVYQSFGKHHTFDECDPFLIISSTSKKHRIVCMYMCAKDR